MIRCEWFARCDREAVGLVAQADELGDVPCCDRCAELVGLDFVERFRHVYGPEDVHTIDDAFELVRYCGVLEDRDRSTVAIVCPTASLIALVAVDPALSLGELVADAPPVLGWAIRLTLGGDLEGAPLCAP